MKRVIKENKVLFVLAIIILVSLGVIVYGLITYFYSEDGDKYGNRLNGIKDYKISETIDKDIKSLFEEGVEKVSVDIKGKIIYIILDVSDGVTKVDARNYALKTLEEFSEEEKSFYDIQFMVTCEKASEDTTMYPMMGYKNSSNSQVVWTNN